MRRILIIGILIATITRINIGKVEVWGNWCRPIVTEQPESSKTPIMSEAPESTNIPEYVNPTKAPVVTAAPNPSTTQKPQGGIVPETTKRPQATLSPEVTKPQATSLPEVPETTKKPQETLAPKPEITKQPENNNNSNQSYAQQVVRLVNEERKKAGLAELTFDSANETAALVRAKEIQISFSHTRPDGSGFQTALTQAGVKYRGCGENIAWGQRSPEEVMQGWMNSSGHRANILNKNFTKIGVGYVQNANGVNYWTQLFTY